MRDFNCPYCNEVIDFDPDEPMGQDARSEEDCPHCDKKIIVTCNYTVSYDAEKADCLNGGDHNRCKCYSSLKGEFNECSACNERKFLDDKRNKNAVG